MTDIFELVERARPDVDPIPQADRRRFREELFHDGRRTSKATADAALVVPWQTRRRARRLVAIVALLLIGGGIALFVLRDDGTADPGEAAEPATSVAATAAPTTAAPVEEEVVLPVVFDPVLFGEPPAGYQLHWARFDGDRAEEAVGLARYTHPDGGPELVILLRPVPGLFTGPVADGIQTWEVDGRTVIASPDSGPCSADSCSVDVQWDEITALSVAWVNWDGTSLEASVDRDLLVDLVGGLSPQPEKWESGPIDSAHPTWGIPTAATAPLLLPGDTAEIVFTAHLPRWPGASTVVVASPDGSFISLQEGDGPQVPLAADATETRGAVTFVPPQDPGAVPLAYDLELTCGFAQLADVPGSAIMRPDIVQLLDAMTIDRGEIAIALPDGWSKVADGPNGDAFVATFLVDLRGEATEVTLLQSPGGSVATLMYGGRQLEEIDFAGGTAWRQTNQENAEDVTVVGQRAGTAYEIGGSGVSIEDLEVLLGSLVPATVEGWEGRFGELQTTDIDTSCSQQPFFTVVPAG